MDFWTWVIICIVLFGLLDGDAAFTILAVIIVVNLILDDDALSPTPELAPNVLEIQGWDCPNSNTCVIGDNNEVILNVKVHPGGVIPVEGGYIKVLVDGEPLPEPVTTEEE